MHKSSLAAEKMAATAEKYLYSRHKSFEEAAMPVPFPKLQYEFAGVQLSKETMLYGLYKCAYMATVLSR